MLIENAPANLIVIDTGNYYPLHRDGKSGFFRRHG
jgi:hypothetical protein